MIAGALAVLALAGVGCSADGGGSPAASSVPPQGFPECTEIYAQGTVVNDDTFGLACVQDGVIVSPAPGPARRAPTATSCCSTTWPGATRASR